MMAKAMSWDDEFSTETKSFVVLENGEYDFSVKAFERAWFDGSTKLPPCPKAELTLEVETAEGVASIKENLFLVDNAQWKVATFFRSLGLLQGSSKSFKPQWHAVVGGCGRAKITKRTYKNNNGDDVTVNNVKEFLPKEMTKDGEVGF